MATGPKTGAALLFPPGAGWRDLTLAATAAGTGGTAPGVGAMLISGYRTYFFANGALDELFFAFHPNHDYRPGSDIYFHIYWAPSTIDTGIAEFKIDYSFARMQDDGPSFVQFPLVQTLTITQNGSGTVEAHQVAESAAFLPAGFETDGLLLARVYRDARITNPNDTILADAWILTVDLHYEVGQIATTNRVRGSEWVY